MKVVELLCAAGLTLSPNKTFNPKRAPIIVPKDGWKGIRAGPVGKVTDPRQNVVCKCERVTEHEVVTALHRSLPIDSTQAIRKRTRAGTREIRFFLNLNLFILFFDFLIPQIIPPYYVTFIP
jgi:glycerol-3-phosphate dehydrogenase